MAERNRYGMWETFCPECRYTFVFASPEESESKCRDHPCQLYQDRSRYCQKEGGFCFLCPGVEMAGCARNREFEPARYS